MLCKLYFHICYCQGWNHVVLLLWQNDLRDLQFIFIISVFQLLLSLSLVDPLKSSFHTFFFLLFIRESMANIKIICCKILPWEVLLYQGMRMVQCHPQRCCSHCSERGCIPSFRHCKIHCMSFKISAAMPLKICKVQCLGNGEKQLFRTTGNFHAAEGCGKRTENRRRL